MGAIIDERDNGNYTEDQVGNDEDSYNKDVTYDDGDDSSDSSEEEEEYSGNDSDSNDDSYSSDDSQEYYCPYGYDNCRG